MTRVQSAVLGGRTSGPPPTLGPKGPDPFDYESPPSKQNSLPSGSSMTTHPPVREIDDHRRCARPATRYGPIHLSDCHHEVRDRDEGGSSWPSSQAHSRTPAEGRVLQDLPQPSKDCRASPASSRANRRPRSRTAPGTLHQHSRTSRSIWSCPRVQRGTGSIPTALTASNQENPCRGGHFRPCTQSRQCLVAERASPPSDTNDLRLPPRRSIATQRRDSHYLRKMAYRSSLRSGPQAPCQRAVP